MIRCASKAVVAALICVAMVGCKGSSSSPVVGIASFSAEGGTGRDPGDDVTLTWSVSNAAACSIVDGDGVSVVSNTTASTFEWTAHKSTMLVLSCVDADGHVASKSLYMTVSVVEIASFTAKLGDTPITADVEKDATVTLAWSALNGTTCSIVDAKGNSVVEDTTESTEEWTADASTMLTLTCTDSEDNTVTKSLYVGVKGAPGIPSFAVSPEHTYPDGTVTFTWVSQNTTECVLKSGGTAITGGSNLAASGSKTGVTVAETTTFTLDCTGTNGTHTTSEVTVTTDVLRIASFQKEGPNNAGAYTVTWRVDNAESCVMKGNDCAWTAQNNLCSFALSSASGSPTGSGSVNVTPSEPLTLELSCTKGSDTKKAYLALSGTQAIINSFDVSPSHLKGEETLTFAWRTSNTKENTCDLYAGNVAVNGKTNLPSNGLTTLAATDDAIYILKCKNLTESETIVSDEHAVTVDVAITAFASSSGSAPVEAAGTPTITITAVDAKANNACTLTDDRNSTPVSFMHSENTTTYTATYTVPAFNGNSVLQLTVNCTGNNTLTTDTASKTLILYYAAGTLGSTLIATPSLITVKDGPSTITWGSQGAQGCSLKEDVTNAPELKSGTSGSLTVENLTTKKTYKLTCNNFGSTSTDIKTVDVDVFYFDNVNDPSNPLKPTVDKASVKKYLENITVSAKITGATTGDTCTVNTGWIVSDPTNGVFTATGPISGTTDVVMTCKRGTTAIVSDAVRVTVTDPNVSPSITFVTTPAATTVDSVTATRIDYRKDVTITATVAGTIDGDTCTADPGGSLSRSGNVFSGTSVGLSAQNSNITVTCKRGDIIIATATVPVIVTQPAIAITTTPAQVSGVTTVDYLQDMTLTAVSSGLPTTSCEASTGWSVTKSDNTFTFRGRLAETTSITVTCTQATPSASISASLVVNVRQSAASVSNSSSSGETCDIFVKPGGGSPQDGTTWAKAYASLAPIQAKTVCVPSGFSFTGVTVPAYVRVRSDCTQSAVANGTSCLSGDTGVCHFYVKTGGSDSSNNGTTSWSTAFATFGPLLGKTVCAGVGVSIPSSIPGYLTVKKNCTSTGATTTCSAEDQTPTCNYYVTTTGGATIKDGSSWTNAYDSMSPVLALVSPAASASAVLSGKKVCMASGVYSDPDSVVNEDRNVLVASNSIATKTTFKGGCVADAVTTDTPPVSICTPSASETILDGHRLTRLMTIRSGSVTLKDLTFRAGRTTSAANYGGCLLITDGASVAMENVNFVECMAEHTTDGFGGGIYVGKTTSVSTAGVITVNAASTTPSQLAWRGGWAQGNDAFRGGVLMVDVGSTVQISDLTAVNNGSLGLGGSGGGVIAVYGDTSAVSVENSIFKSNISDSAGGGAIYLQNNSFLDVAGCSFLGNIASYYYGGAIYGNGVAPVVRVRHSLFNGNTTNWGSVVTYGGAISLISSGPAANARANLLISGSTFSGNTARTGGAIYAKDSDVIFSQSRFDGNSSYERGGAVYFEESTTSQLLSFGIFETEFTYNQSYPVVYDGSNGFGGAISVSSQKLNFRIEDSRFQYNTGNNWGGAIDVRMNSAVSSVVIKRSSFEGNGVNTIARGGAISTYEGSLADVEIEDSEFIGNRAYHTGNVAWYGAGGALMLEQGQNRLRIDRSYFAYNRATEGGGAITVGNDSGNVLKQLEISNTTFIGNSLYSPDASASRTFAGVAVSMKATVNAGFIRDTSFRENVGALNWPGASTQSFGGSLYFHSTVGVSGTPFRLERVNFLDNVHTTGSSAGLSANTTAYMTIEDSTFARNTAGRFAALEFDGDNSVYSIVNSRIIDNLNENIYVDGINTVNGGAVYLRGTATLEGVQFKNNKGAYNGGAIWHHSGTTTVRDCDFINNEVSNFGGAIYEYSGTLNVVNSTFAGNKALDGGAIYQNLSSPGPGTLKIYLSTFTGNIATTTTTPSFDVKQSGATIKASVFASSAASSGVAESTNGANGICVSTSAVTLVGDKYFYTQPASLGPNSGCKGNSSDITMTTSALSLIMGCSGTCLDFTSAFADYTLEGNDGTDGSGNPIKENGSSASVFPGRHYKVSTRRLYVKPNSGNTCTLENTTVSGRTITMDGTSWESAFPCPSNAVVAINRFARIQPGTTILENYEVWVQKGVYNETATLVLPERTSWFGGFEGVVEEKERFHRPALWRLPDAGWSKIQYTSANAGEVMKYAGTSSTPKTTPASVDGFILSRNSNATATSVTGLKVEYVADFTARNMRLEGNIGAKPGFEASNVTGALVLENVQAKGNNFSGTPAVLTFNVTPNARLENVYIDHGSATGGATGVSVTGISTLYARNLTLRGAIVDDTGIKQDATAKVYLSESVVYNPASGKSSDVTSGGQLLLANTCLFAAASGTPPTDHKSWNVIITPATSLSTDNLLNPASACADAVQPLPACPNEGATTPLLTATGRRWCMDAQGIERICTGTLVSSTTTWTCATATIPSDTGIARNGSTRTDKLWDVGRKDFGFHTPARIWYVNPEADAGGDGKSWGTAFQTITSATAAATTAGDAIWITGGTYRATNVRDAVLKVPAGVSVFGGFAGYESSPIHRRRGLTSTVTIFDGDMNGDAAWSAEDSTNVSTNAGDIALDGVRITGGNGRGSNDGAGLYVALASSQSALLSNLEVMRNTARSGAGMYITSSYDRPTAPNVLLYNVRTHDNHAVVDGGGVYLAAKVNALIEDGSMRNNGVDQSGGALYNAGQVELRNVVIDRNAALNGGGIALANDVLTTLSNVQLSRNDGGLGGGIYIAKFFKLAIIQSTLAENTANKGAAIFAESFNGGTTVAVTQSIVAGNLSSDGKVFALADAALTVSYNGSCVDLTGSTTEGTIYGIDSNAVVAVPWTTGEVNYVLPKASVCRNLGGTVGAGVAYDLRARSTSPGGESEYSRDTCTAYSPDPGYHAPAIDRTFCAYRPGIDL